MSAHWLSACDAALQLAQRQLRAQDLLRDCLERISEREPQVQAWSHVASQAALARARALDQGAHQGLLHGLPIGVKDLIATADMPTTSRRMTPVAWPWRVQRGR